jgi:oxygen-independent coproporphyrinogen-3 oxidase
VRGLRLSGDDRLRADVIERLMCDFAVDLGTVCRRHGRPLAALGDWAGMLDPLSRDGLVEIDGALVTVTWPGRDFVRLVASAFDEYLTAGKARHASAV